MIGLYASVVHIPKKTSLPNTEAAKLIQEAAELGHEISKRIVKTFTPHTINR